jgi:hypothetical protein
METVLLIKDVPGVAVSAARSCAGVWQARSGGLEYR